MSKSSRKGRVINEEVRKEKDFDRYNKNLLVQLVPLHRRALKQLLSADPKTINFYTNVNLLFSDVQKHIKSKRGPRSDHSLQETTARHHDNTSSLCTPTSE